MANERASIEEIRGFYARLMVAASRSSDPRLERAFEVVPREAFFPPGPWKVMINLRYFDTPSADPVYLYHNVLVALDADKGINNGEPSLHAAWLGAVAPQRGEAVTHIGAGTGYYSAILSMLVLPTGTVTAFEIDKSLAEKARLNLEPFEGVSVINADATQKRLPKSDVIYVNAGVAAPPIDWLRALKPGGRMIFPWRPSEEVALTLLVRADSGGFSAKPLMPAWFIPCVGASREVAPSRVPANFDEARTIRSIWRKADRFPDQSAIAIYPDVWFSSEPTTPIAIESGK
ncbi:protein-L-isoaspartate O-methyltransferase family protein [Agrobacterium radiobacter]|jgi:protein-L-isoaspartate(D-aspartate) O-methyltransferase|uniref:protein-L-isoaspartate O-methyltransferase family protein n=1 Tax=Agrobacterium radiobacter TaxID=362 RepID=UPI001606A375|nr:protein-L-isoaspartate O-methyltransferase [Agrobacterium radiobacter]MBB4409513.1 protein-L-isoaspartate(D-aspartate) O-methyltransferase [Agrobacterium radiobacter]MBB4454887.1 protein-L-isoaspartate(D-aspartate) O-methyltransferase [Agrobacterium radiobacter]